MQIFLQNYKLYGSNEGKADAGSYRTCMSKKPSNLGGGSKGDGPSKIPPSSSFWILLLLVQRWDTGIFTQVLFTATPCPVDFDHAGPATSSFSFLEISGVVGEVGREKINVSKWFLWAPGWLHSIGLARKCRVIYMRRSETAQKCFIA